MEPERIKISVAARILDVTPLTLRRGIYAGRIPFIKTDTKRLFIPMSWIRQQIGNAVPEIEIITKSVTDYCIKKYGQKKGQKLASKILKVLE